MRVSLRWLRDYCECNVSVDELAEKLTMLGLEIETIERLGQDIDGVVVGRVLTVQPHPDADRLSVCTTDVGQQHPLQIVCGATNMKPGDLVPTALVGGALPGGFQIAKRKMRGVESQGMMCSIKELGLGEDQAGLMILQGDPPLGEDIRTTLGLDDAILELEVTPNRGDWASMIGVARELAALLRTPYTTPQVHIRESDEPAAGLSSVTIENPDLCPRYIGRVLKNVTIGPSPGWLVQRLLAAGQRPINNIVDITNYVLLETGHPLHAFDLAKLAEGRVVVRNARPGETIRTIDGELRELAPDMLVIADARAPVAVAGVMGGMDSEVGEGTHDVFLESAYFNPGSIRNTARALGMQTEASQHFQRGADVAMVEYAINRAAALMHELAGATLCAGLLDEYPNPIAMPEVTLRYQRAQTVLGTAIDPEFQKTALEHLGFDLRRSDNDGCTVRVPTWRHDVTIEADLIEEVARLYGYDKILTTVPSVRRTDQILAPQEERLAALRRHLVARGLTEIINWSFCARDDVHKAGLEDAFLDMVALTNPLSEKHACMRSSLIPDILNTVAFNLRHGNLAIAIFELGPVFRPLPDQELPEQRMRLGIALTGDAGSPHWSAPPRAFDFYDLKGIAQDILDFFGLSVSLDPVDDATFMTGHAAELRLDNVRLGLLGALRPEVAQRFGIDQLLHLLDLDLDALLHLPAPIPEFQPIPAFPPSLRDIAVVVDTSVQAGNLRHTALEAGGKLLRKVDIFDVYTGKPIPEGKKSVALSLVFQSDERTLTDQDTQKAFDRIVKKLQSAHQAQLR
jgi:phenylalanyl-tRNA synthetase beta chain